MKKNAKILSISIAMVILCCMLSSFLSVSSNIQAFSYYETVTQSNVFSNSSTVDELKTLADEIYFSNLDEVKNRTTGYSGEKKFAQILAGEMDELSLSFVEGDSYIQTFSLGQSSSQNVLGLIDNQSEKYVVLGAHLDAVYVQGKSFGFSDNLSGVLGVLQMAQILSSTELPFNVIIAFYGAEEVGCKGSKYFVENLEENIKKNILLSMNFDSIGSGEKQYFYHSDNPTKYGAALDNIIKNYEINKAGFNSRYSPVVSLDINFTSLGIMSDNSSYLKHGINAVTFFAGDLDAINGLGFFEKQGYDKIMHNTDTAETNLEIFGDLFYENITNCIELTTSLLASQEFNEENFAPNQVNVILFSVWAMKIVGVILILIILAIYFIVINKKYPKRNLKNKKK